MAWRSVVRPHVHRIGILPQKGPTPDGHRVTNSESVAEWLNRTVSQQRALCEDGRLRWRKCAGDGAEIERVGTIDD